MKLQAEEFLARCAEVHGTKYDYSKTVYIKSSAKVEVVCPTHGSWWPVAKDHVGKKTGCPACVGKKRITQEDFVARSSTVYEGKYDYSRSVFTKSAEPVEVVCPEHGSWWPTANNHLMGRAGCPSCADNKKMTTEEFLQKTKGLHGSTYGYRKARVSGNNKSKVIITCREHGDFEMTINCHLLGQGCPKCAFKGHITKETMVSEAIDIHGGKFDYTDTAYVNSSTKMVIGCNTCGNRFRMTYGNHVIQKQGCPFCAGKRITTEDWVATARATNGEKYDYQYSQYFGSKGKVLIVCPEHGPFWSGASSHANSGHGCPECGCGWPSKGQKEIHNFVETLARATMESKVDSSKMRYDILIQEHNLAIEYHGLIWHSAKYAVDVRKDYKKHVASVGLGIRVIHVFEDEWKTKPGIVKNLIAAALGALPRLQARKLAVFRIATAEADAFYTANHIQGRVGSQVNLALLDSGTVVGCMSFSVLRSERRNINKRHWELTRYASCGAITGGAGRLLSAFKNLGLADIITSYSDVRMFSGKMYEALGFVRTHETRPDYCYTDGQVRVHKAKFQKSRLAKMYPGCDMKKTEREICEENGWYQLFDCGKVRWDYTVQYSNGTSNSIDSHPSRCSLRPGYGLPSLTPETVV